MALATVLKAVTAALIKPVRSGIDPSGVVISNQQKNEANTH